MHDLFLLIAGIGLGSFILVIVRIMCEFNHIVTTRVFSLLLLGAACYMLQPFVMNAPNVSMALKIVSTVTPALFWMCASTLFNTEQTKHRLHWGHYLGGMVCFCLGLYTCVFSSPSVEHSFTHTLTLLLTVLLVLMGMLDIFRNWESDLVDCRRKLRLSLACTSGGFLLFVVASEFLFGHGRLPDWLNYLNVSFISGYALVLGYLVLISKTNLVEQSIDELSIPLVKEKDVAPSPADKAWLTKLTQAMDEERVYRQVDLTIRSLSSHLSVPEHQLRRLINQHLGYRNFNDYLNRYRIEEAAGKLSDPLLIRTPILTIAIESGYASLTTFNKAFKKFKEMTPSEFRRNVANIS